MRPLERAATEALQSATVHSRDATLALSGKFPSRAAISCACSKQMKVRN
jgi:hypothetical protein